MTTVLQVADSVTAQLNAAEFDFEFVAERMYVPSFDLEDMKELRVSVVVPVCSINEERPSERPVLLLMFFFRCECQALLAE